MYAGDAPQDRAFPPEPGDAVGGVVIVAVVSDPVSVPDARQAFFVSDVWSKSRRNGVRVFHDWLEQ